MNISSLFTNLPPAARKVLAVLLAVAAVFGVSVAIETDDRGATITIRVLGPVGPTTVTTTTEAVEEAVDRNTHEGARDETPTGATGLAPAQEQQERFAERDRLPTEIPDAAPLQRGCRTRLVQNKSSRNGVRPRLLVMHYTVSPNRPGFEDVNAITNLFNRPSFAASSHFVIDRDGNCNYIVREAEKSWTQATANPVSISWEIINTGSERPLFTPFGLARFARIVSDSAERWRIPIRAGRVSNCRVVQSGIIDHKTLGACGGGHHDISPFSIGDLISAVENYRSFQNRGDRKSAKWCRSLRILRAQARAGRSTAERRVRARELKALLENRRVACV